LSVSGYALAFARRAGLRALIGVWLGCAHPAAAASLSGRDVQIIAKALGFLDPPPPGGTVAVVYASGDAASKADAAAIVALFGGGLASGGGTVTAKEIDTRSFGDGTGYVAVILAAGVGNTALATAMKHGLLCITAADGLVQSGRCVMAVHSEPRVDITVNRAAAQAAGVGFTAAFGMLVHEI
jgi:hypothetical protein